MTTDTASADARYAASGQDVLIRLRGLAPTLVPSLRRVADRILTDPGAAATLTISELAGAAETSVTTVQRLCQALDVGGYRDLRVALAAESGREEGRSGVQVGRDIAPGAGIDAIVETVMLADQHAIADTTRTIDRQALLRAVDAVAGARRIEIYGVAASAIVARDLQQKLHRIGLVAFVNTDLHAALTGVALLGPSDVVIGVSHTGSTRDTVEVMAQARRTGALAIGLTSVPRSPLAEMSDLLLVTASRETTFRSGAMSSRIAALSVVDVLFVAVAQHRYEQSVAALDSTRHAVAHRRFDRAPASPSQPGPTALSGPDQPDPVLMGRSGQVLMGQSEQVLVAPSEPAAPPGSGTPPKINHPQQAARARRHGDAEEQGG